MQMFIGEYLEAGAGIRARIASIATLLLHG
jgi:hypothetical protein